MSGAVSAGQPWLSVAVSVVVAVPSCRPPSQSLPAIAGGRIRVAGEIGRQRAAQEFDHRRRRREAARGDRPPPAHCRRSEAWRPRQLQRAAFQTRSAASNAAPPTSPAESLRELDHPAFPVRLRRRSAPASPEQRRRARAQIQLALGNVAPKLPLAPISGSRAPSAALSSAPSEVTCATSFSRRGWPKPISAAKLWSSPLRLSFAVGHRQRVRAQRHSPAQRR